MHSTTFQQERAKANGFDALLALAKRKGMKHPAAWAMHVINNRNKNRNKKRK